MAEKIKLYYHEYNKAQAKEEYSKRRTLPARWKPPEEEEYKVNFDASFFVNTRVGGAGIVIRDMDGFVLASAAIKTGSAMNATMAEAMAAKCAVQFALDCGFTKIVLEGDSLNVFKALRSEEEDFSSIGPWVDECKHLATAFHRIKFLFTMLTKWLMSGQISFFFKL